MSSVFRVLLQQLCDTIPGAMRASFVDWEGETVDFFAPQIAQRDRMLLEAAHFEVIHNLLKQRLRATLGAMIDIAVSFERYQILIASITEDYALVIVCDQSLHLGRALVALQQAKTSFSDQL